MRVLSLEVSDILSIHQASLSFEDSGLVLVEGWNYDTGRANGAGKTALFNCLSFGLYDKLPRKITASEILRRGCKTGFVKVSVLCGEDVWTVQRSRPKGVKFFKNGLEQDIAQSEFEGFIRLSYDQFLLTVYTPQANSGQLERFLSSPDAGKKSFLLQLLNLEGFSDRKAIVDDKVKEITLRVDKSNNQINTDKAKIAAYQESIVDEEEINDELKKLDVVLGELYKRQQLYTSVPEPDFSRYQKTEEEIRKKQTEFTQARTKRGMLHDKYRELSASLQPYDPNVKCSECGNSLDTEQGRISHEAHQEKVKNKLSEIKLQIDECDNILYKEQAVNDLAKKLRDKKSEESEDYKQASFELSEIKSLVRANQLKRENLSLKLKSNQELQNKIDSLNDSVKKLDANLLSSKQELELYKTLSALYSPTGAQAYVLDSVVDSFNEVIQKYVDILSPNMSYTLNSYKETSKGDVVAKFSETLTKGGSEVSVGSLSGGEQKGLSLCVDFALLEVLETQFGMSLNPIILDEPFDGLDAAGREIVIELLETLAKNRQIFVVDHASEAKTLFSKTIRVLLKNDISTISLDS